MQMVRFHTALHIVAHNAISLHKIEMKKAIIFLLFSNIQNHWRSVSATLAYMLSR